MKHKLIYPIIIAQLMAGGLIACNHSSQQVVQSAVDQGATQEQSKTSDLERLAKKKSYDQTIRNALLMLIL